MRLGVVQALAASYNEAFSTLDKVIEQDSSQFMFWFERANARLQLSKYLYSISPIQDPFNSDGKEEEEVDFLAEHYGKMIRDYTKVLRLAPEFSYAWYNRAYGRALSGDFEGAVRDLTQAIRYNPSMAEAFYNRGIMSVLFVGNPSIGCSDLSEAGEMGITEAYAIIKKNCNP
jgi:tetratricopeptide (TPR) repeat protein